MFFTHHEEECYKHLQSHLIDALFCHKLRESEEPDSGQSRLLLIFLSVFACLLYTLLSLDAFIQQLSHPFSCLCARGVSLFCFYVAYYILDLKHYHREQNKGKNHSLFCAGCFQHQHRNLSLLFCVFLYLPSLEFWSCSLIKIWEITHFFGQQEHCSVLLLSALLFGSSCSESAELSSEAWLIWQGEDTSVQCRLLINLFLLSFTQLYLLSLWLQDALE